MHIKWGRWYKYGVRIVGYLARSSTDVHARLRWLPSPAGGYQRFLPILPPKFTGTYANILEYTDSITKRDDHAITSTKTVKTIASWLGESSATIGYVIDLHEVYARRAQMLNPMRFNCSKNYDIAMTSRSFG